ncbi:unnamed protein product [Cylicocyclus nassatus]|uniref:Uncharacterized protein n=1 Tax=Cylicocyclus nassatus TaxID=53992 RepID=A0AA36H786_CYLNA|nr:unnamed protein product [Cylicocyclus nassatus]CAJ0605055.1 unnamed protein product [Cylicocyclus nassatus]
MVSQRRNAKSKKSNETVSTAVEPTSPSAVTTSNSQEDEGLQTLFYRRFVADIIMAFKVLRAEVWAA